MKDRIKYIGRKLIYVYNIVYPVINTLIFLLMYEKLDNTSLIIFVIYLVIEYWIWIKRQIPYMRMLYDFLAKVTDKSVLAIYGGVGSGKTTLATYLMNKYYPKESHYYNFKVDGAKIFNHQHLFLKEKLIEKPCVLIDEAGGFYDSFKYDKKYNAERKEIITFNKYFRQFYGDGLCIYVDQAESNLNTALYRSIYFVVQLDSIRTTMSSPVMYMFYKLIHVNE